MKLEIFNFQYSSNLIVHLAQRAVIDLPIWVILNIIAGEIVSGEYTDEDGEPMEFGFPRFSAIVWTLAISAWIYFGVLS